MLSTRRKRARRQVSLASSVGGARRRGITCSPGRRTHCSAAAKPVSLESRDTQQRRELTHCRVEERVGMGWDGRWTNGKAIGPTWRARWAEGGCCAPLLPSDSIPLFFSNHVFRRLLSRRPHHLPLVVVVPARPPASHLPFTSTNSPPPLRLCWLALLPPRVRPRPSAAVPAGDKSGEPEERVGREGGDGCRLGWYGLYVAFLPSLLRASSMPLGSPSAAPSPLVSKTIKLTSG